MPVRVDKISVHPSLHRRANKLYKRDSHSTKIIAYSANNVMKGSHFCSVHSFIFKMIDKISPFINKHPKILNKVMNISEKVLKNSDSFIMDKEYYK